LYAATSPRPVPSAASATLVLRRPEQELARLVVADRLAQPGQYLDAALHRRPGRDGLEPGLDRGSRRGRCPGSSTSAAREDGDVGDRVFVAGHERRSGRGACRARRRASSPRCCSVDGVGDLLRGVHPEVVRLAKHRPDAAHLEHQPLERRIAAAQIGRRESARSWRRGRPGWRPIRKRDRLPVRPSGSTMAGILLFGLIARNSGVNCSPAPMSTGMAR